MCTIVYTATIPTVTCLRLSDASFLCRVTYFQFPTQSAFLQYIARLAAPALQYTIGFNMQYRTSDAAKHLGKYLSCGKRTAQGEDFELILTVKISHIRDWRSTPTYCRLQSHVTQKLGQKSKIRP